MTLRSDRAHPPAALTRQSLGDGDRLGM
jgi:hypothetical protein